MPGRHSPDNKLLNTKVHNQLLRETEAWNGKFLQPLEEGNWRESPGAVLEVRP